ncbi:DDE_3 domain-containing protein [Trichonephila clavipes]|uniref:DDE_3 domain-containing protein n=1 Tax=Trichonephila clavipes TaxID=2585209 RepID=A0A8X6RBS7_TRICX|nr:DDE_3 domain-containing protein [Trichonephila clavipes]
MGFRSQRPPRVPLLTARHKALRLAEAYQHQHWSVDVWEHVAWSEESRFQLNRADGRVQKYSSEFRRFRWPPKSQDMNVIQHIWDVMQHAVQKRSPPPLTPTDL